MAATCVGMISTQVAAAPSASRAREFDAPSGLTFGAGHLWVANEAGNSVSEINPSDGTWMATFTSGGRGFKQPTAITSFGPDLFIANGAGSVSEIRARDGALVRIISGAKYGFVDPVAIEVAGSKLYVLNAGRPSAATPVAGSITEINARTGTLVRRVTGPRFAFDDPVAFAVSGSDVFVADKSNNSMTEVSTTTGALVRVVAQQGLSAPDGIAVQEGNVWVADSGSNSATEIAAATGAVIVTETNSDGDYGFGNPLMVIGSAGNIFVASPFGTSPMVTKLSATNGQPSWYMCNTNGPYYFSLLSAFAVSGDHLWVASRSGANSQTPGASTGSLTELSTTDGSLITTLPSPTPVSTTTTTIPTSTTTTSTP
jgi:sugar lactone lactonase YvrE